MWTWIYQNWDLIAAGLAVWAVLMLVWGSLHSMNQQDEDHDAPPD